MKKYRFLRVTFVSKQRFETKVTLTLHIPDIFVASKSWDVRRGGPFIYRNRRCQRLTHDLTRPAFTHSDRETSSGNPEKAFIPRNNAENFFHPTRFFIHAICPIARIIYHASVLRYS